MQPLPRGCAMLRRTLVRPHHLKTSRPRLSHRRWAHDAQGGPSAGGAPPPPPPPPQPPRFGEEQTSGWARKLGLVAVFSLSAGVVYYLYPGPTATPGKAEKPQKTPKAAKVQPEVEKKPAQPTVEPGKGNREHPGVYAWGSNAGGVIDPSSKETIFKAPRRIAFFDGQVLRDLKLRSNFGAAISEKGDLIMWGNGVSSSDPSPVTALQGKDLVKLAVSSDRVVALSSRGTVYSMPASREDQLTGEKPSTSQSSWIPFWSSTAQPDVVNYRILTPGTLKSGEKIVDIRSGLGHCLMLTSKGRVFSAAASTLEYPLRGQLGIPDLTWTTRPEGAYDQPHEVTELTKGKIVQIAAGDLHSAVLDDKGRVVVWGDNLYGQLGHTGGQGKQFVDRPAPLAVDKLYAKSAYTPRVTSVAAGGNTTFFTAEATPVPATSDDTEREKDIPSATFDVWACGGGLHGTLGTGKFTHASGKPSKVRSLSAAFEFDEATNKLAPLRIARLSVGDSHVAAVMAAKTSGDVGGADVLVWGGNEHYQLGTGRRTNLHTPTFVAGLDSASRNPDEVLPGDDQRLQLAPRRTVRLDGGKGRKVAFEQRVECGGPVTAVYSGV